MAFYGNDFVTATLINNSEQILDGEMVAANTADFFRFVITETTNRITVLYRNITGHSDTYTRVYDSSENLISEYKNSSNTWYHTYVDILDLVPGTYYLELYRRRGTESDYELEFWLSEGGDIMSLHTSIARLEEISSLPVEIDAIGPAQFQWDVSTIPYIGLDPASIFDVYRSGEHYISNPENFVIQPSFRSPAIIMMGHRSGVKTPLIQGNEPHYNIHGKVTAEGVVLANKRLRLYDRTTGQLIGETHSDILGNYSFPNPLWQDSKYYVVAFDDVDSPVLQAVIHDALVPIPL